MPGRFDLRRSPVGVPTEDLEVDVAGWLSCVDGNDVGRQHLRMPPGPGRAGRLVGRPIGSTATPI